MVFFFAAVAYTSLQLRLRGFERDMRAYLLERGVTEQEIVSVKASLSSLPTYPVIVKLSQEPERGYLFTPDSRHQGNFLLIDDLPPQLPYTDDPLEPERPAMRDKAYLEAYGFSNIQPFQDLGSYILTAEKAAESPYREYWALQKVDPSLYYGQAVHTHQYVVEHPGIRKKLGLSADTTLYACVMVVGDLARGGYLHSGTVSGERPTGSGYSLRGETIEK
ncbi:hypothetical protein B9G55_18250 [Saccharibacillus sp. O16]|nr:hypothetical protein B9G55_18250 [Saccharibacillus sp. O16]